MNVGFIGLGVMGKRMATNILKGGFNLKVNDIVKSAVEDMEEIGAEGVDTPAKLAADCDVVLTSLPNSKIVNAVVTGKNGILEGAKPGTVFVDLSSITPKAIQEIAKKASEKGVEVLDAPVSGGSSGAAAGTLTIMIGGKQETLEKVRPVLDCIGKTIYHVGDVGAGDTVKLVNNLLLGANMVATAEALALGAKAGIDQDVLFDVVSKSSGNSYALTAKYPKFISKRNFEPGFMIDLQFKDLQLAVDTAKNLGMPLIMGNIAQQMYEIARANGLGKEDISSVLKVYENWAKTAERKDG